MRRSHQRSSLVMLYNPQIFLSTDTRMGIFLDLEAAFDWVGYSGLSSWLLRQLPHDFPPAALTALRQWLLWVSGPSSLLALHILGSLYHPHVPSTRLGTSSLLLFSEL